MTNTTKGIKEMQKLNTEEREMVYGKLQERGASDKTINELKALVSVADWFRK